MTRDDSAVDDPRPTDQIPPDPLVGAMIGGCHIDVLLGRGAMGVVYRARQTRLDRVVAVKTIREGLLNEDKPFLRFQQEARTVSRCRTPHVVQIHEVGLDRGIHFIVMEYASGGNLGSYTRKQPDGRLTPRDAIRFMTQAAIGLLAAEELQVVHRDVKPENLLLDHTGRVKITDFGIAKILDASTSLTMDSSILGTPLYMSPEQARASKVSHHSDIYSLGATFFHLLTGKLPVTGKSTYDLLHKRVHTKFLSPARVLPDGAIPAGLNDLIEKMTANDPGDRHESFKAVADDLRGILEGEAAAATMAPVAGASRRRRGGAGRKRCTAIAGTTAVLVAAVGVFMALGIPGDAPDELTLRSPLAAGALSGGTGPADVATTGEAISVAPPPSVAPEPRDPAEHEESAAAAAGATSLETAVERLRARVSAGPDAATLAVARGLLERVSAARPGDEDLRGAVESLAHDCRLGQAVEEGLRKIGLPGQIALEFPLDDFCGYRQGIRDALTLPEAVRGTIGPELRDWLECRRERVLAALADDVGKSMDTFAGEARQALSRFQGRELSVNDMRAFVSSFRTARSRVRQTVPERPDDDLRELKKLIAEIETRIAARQQLDVRIGTLEDEAGKLVELLDGVESSVDWTATVDGHILTRVREIDAAASQLVREDPAAPTTGLTTTLEEIRSRRRTRQRHAGLVADVVAFLAGGYLERAGTALEEIGSIELEDPRVHRLVSAQDALVEAFGRIADLDLRRAEWHFERAGVALQNAPTATDYVARCRRRLEELQQLTRDMAPVRAGMVRIPGTDGPTRVESFLVDRHETSITEFRQFLESQNAVTGFDEVRDLWSSEEIFMAGRHRPAYLESREFTLQSWPIEEITYHQARAYLRSRRKDLPVLEEWWLAARGPLVDGRHVRKYPAYPDDIHRRAETPCPVNRGSASRGPDAARSVHHLAGNVAEWVKRRSAESRVSRVVVGRYLDEDMRYFSGVRLDTMGLGDTRRGYGCRGVVRPAEFFAGLLPR